MNILADVESLASEFSSWVASKAPQIAQDEAYAKSLLNVLSVLGLTGSHVTTVANEVLAVADAINPENNTPLTGPEKLAHVAVAVKALATTAKLPKVASEANTVAQTVFALVANTPALPSQPSTK